MCHAGCLLNMIKHSSSKQSEKNPDQGEMKRNRGFCLSLCSELHFPSLSLETSSIGSQWTCSPNQLVLPNLAHHLHYLETPQWPALNTRHLVQAEASRGNAHLIGADNIDDVTELNQQAIDHGNIILGFRFESM